MRQFILLVLITVSLQAKAVIDSTRTITKTFVDSTKFENRIIEEYERLEAYNDANEREGRADENIYVIDPGFFDLETDVWVSVPSAKMPPLQIPEIKKINDRLIEFNNSRQDKLRIYAILYFGFKAYLKSNAAPPAKEYKFENDYKEGLKKYFSEADLERLLKFTYGTMPNTIANVNAAMEAKGYDRIIYSYAGYKFYTPNGTEHYYTWQSLKIFASPDTVVDKTGKKSSVPSKLQKLEKEIAAQGKQQITSYKNKVDYTRQVIENIITAVEMHYDRKEDISDKGITDCGKPLEKLWPVSDSGYKNAVASTAAVYGANDGIIPLGSEYSKYLLLDQPEKFNESNPFLRDRGFITEKLPDLLSLMPSRSDYTLWAIFAKVDFFIPNGERAKFAKEVYERIGFGGSDKVIVVVVPYFSCAKSMGIVHGFDLQLMAAAHGPDEEMNLKMNAAFAREGEGFRSAFEQAFKYVPKDHTYFLNYTLWNGEHVFKSKIEKRVTGHSNFVDVLVFVDDRIDEIKKYLTCMGKYHQRLLSIDPYAKPNSQAAKDDDPRAIYETYLKCLAESGAEINKILLQHPKPTFKMVPGDLCNLKQSRLTGEDGMFLALSFAKASVRKAGIKFWDSKGGDTFEKEHMESDDFYEKKNPFKEKHFIFKLIDVGSLLASFVALDFIFDLSGAVIAGVLGDEAGVAEYTASILIPAVLIQGIKELKIINSVSREAYEMSVTSGGFFVRSGDKMVVAEVGGVANLAPVANDRADLLRAIGIVDEEVLAAAKADPTLCKTLEESMVAKNGEGVAPKSSSPPGYSLDQVRNRVNDRNTVSRYKAARQLDHGLDFIPFLQKIDNAPSIFKLGPFAKEVKELQSEAGWFTLLVDRVEANGKVIVQEDNILKELDAAAIAERIKKGGYPEGEPIRIVSLNSSKSNDIEKLTDELAEKFNTKAKAHEGDISIGETGILKTIGREDNYVHWLEVDYSKLPGPSEIIRKKKFELAERSDRVFTLIPHKIKPNGSVVCRVDGKLMTYTPEDIAELLEKSGLRSDEVIRIGLPKNEFLSSNYDNLPELAKRLNKKVDNQIGYIEDRDFFIEPHNLSYDHPALKKLRESGRLPEYIDEPLVVLGEKKSLVLFTEANYKIVEKDRSLYVVVEEFTENGKIRIYQPFTGKTIELNSSEFLKETERIYGKEAMAGKPLRIVPMAGTLDEVKARKFIEELAQKLQAKVEIAKSTINATEGSVLPVKNLNWFFRNPIDEGMFFLQKNITTAQLNKILDKGDEFAEELGKALSQNNGRYLPQFKSDPTWLEDIYADYTKYNKISLPTFSNIKSISKRLDNMDLPDVLVKDMYDNPLFAKKLDEQLKWLDPSDVRKLKEDRELFNEAIQTVRRKVKLGEGEDLLYFMASKNLEKKLQAEDVLNTLEEHIGDDGMLLVFISRGIDDMSPETLNKFELYSQNHDFLDGFKELYKKQINTPYGANLPLYTTRYQEKHQIFLTGASDNLRGTADAILPQAEWMDVFLHADGNGNFIGEGGRILTPDQVENLIRSNKEWDGHSLRFVVDGENPRASVQPLVDKMDVQAKISPAKRDIINGDVKNWENLAPRTPTVILGQADPEVAELVSLLNLESDYIYIVMHGSPDRPGFILKADGREIFVPTEIAVDKLIDNKAFIQAVTEGHKRKIKLISCHSAANGAAETLSKKLFEFSKTRGHSLQGMSFEIDAPDVTFGYVKYPMNNGETKIIWGTRNKNGGLWQRYKDGTWVGPAKEKPVLEYIGGTEGIVVQSNFENTYKAFIDTKSGDLIKKVVMDRKNDQAYLKGVFDQHPPRDQFIGSSQKDYTPGLRNVKAADDKKDNILYFDNAARSKYELKVKNGQCYVNGTMVSDTGGGGLKFVMDRKGNIYVGEGGLAHSSFVAGDDVVLAGSIEFKNGYVILLDNYSGHYKPIGSALELGLSDLLREFAYRGVDLKKISFNYIQYFN